MDGFSCVGLSLHLCVYYCTAGVSEPEGAGAGGTTGSVAGVTGGVVDAGGVGSAGGVDIAVGLVDVASVVVPTVSVGGVVVAVDVAVEVAVVDDASASVVVAVDDASARRLSVVLAVVVAMTFFCPGRAIWFANGLNHCFGFFEMTRAVSRASSAIACVRRLIIPFDDPLKLRTVAKKSLGTAASTVVVAFTGRE